MRNRAEQLAYATERTIADGRDKLPADLVVRVEGALGDLRKVIETGDTAAMEREMENLTKVSHEMAEQAYKTSARPDPTHGPDSPSNSDDDVIDADFEQTGS